MEDMQEILSSFFEDGALRRGLPAVAYKGRNFWEAECETVFQRNWICIGFAHELKESGDAVPVAIAGKPLLMLRNKNGEMKTFHNICRHRCLMLLDEPKDVGKLIRCPYHSWAYDLDGRLQAAPHFGGVNEHGHEAFNKKDNSLVPVRTHVWNDWIFVNMDGDAEPFEEYAATLKARLDGIEWDKVDHVGTLDFGEVSCNWKFIMENFIEPYHVQFVHRTTTEQPLESHYTFIDGNCMGSAVDLEKEAGTAGSLGVSSRYMALYPNFILGRYFPDQIGVYLNIPTGPRTMMQKRAIYTTQGRTLGRDEVDELKKLWWNVHKEDHEIAERLQLGRDSSISEDGGVLSPVWEDSVRAFQDLVARDVVSANL